MQKLKKNSVTKVELFITLIFTKYSCYNVWILLLPMQFNSFSQVLMMMIEVNEDNFG